MTVTCGWCKRPMGEKCPLCGERADTAAAAGVHYCWNASCGIISFGAGAGGVSDSMCESCRRAKFPVVKAPVPCESAS